MKLTNKHLRQMIKEESLTILSEVGSDEEARQVMNTIKKHQERLATEAGKLNKIFLKKQKLDNALRTVKILPKKAEGWGVLMNEYEEFTKDGQTKKKQIDNEIEAFMSKTQEFMDAGDVKGFVKWEKSTRDDILDRSVAIAEELLMKTADFIFNKAGGSIPEGLPVEHIQNFLNQQIDHFRAMFKKTKEIIKIEQNYLSRLEQKRKRK